MGLDLTTYTLIVEELSRGWISISGVVNTHFIGSYLLMKFGTDEQKDHFLPKMATGEIRAAFSLSEPEVGSDVQGIKSTAKQRDDGDWELNGQKMWVTNGLGSGRRLRAHEDRPEGRSALQGDDLLHHREGALEREQRGRLRRARGAAEDQEDGLQGSRVDRARLQRLPLPGRAHPRWRRRGRRGLSPDDGRARGRAGQRRRARCRHRAARARAGAALLAGAKDVRQADRRAPGDPVQARRDGDQGRGGAAADAQGGAR